MKSLQDIFNEAKRSRPVLLFVHDAEWAMVVLKSFGVDTSEWRLGIEPILGRRLLEKPRFEDTHDTTKFRSRSRDPRSSTIPYHDERYRSSRSRSPTHNKSFKRDRSPIEEKRSPHPVYVVDVKNLYTTMRQIAESASGLPVAEIAHAVRINFEKPDEKVENTVPNQKLPGWCAGNESRYVTRVISLLVCTLRSQRCS